MGTELNLSDLWPSKKEFRNCLIKLKDYYNQTKSSKCSLDTIGYVYIIIVESPTFICYKIGYTACFKKRLALLQRDNSLVKFKLVKLYKFKYRLTALIVEQKLLKLTKKYKTSYKIRNGSSELRSINVTRKFSNLNKLLALLANLEFIEEVCK